jgi:hypothetical protein
MGRQRSSLEKRLAAQRQKAEKLVLQAHGDDALEVICSFTELDCVVDVKLGAESDWIRYVLIEDEPPALRRIG